MQIRKHHGKAFIYSALILSFYITFIFLNKSIDALGYGGGHIRRLFDAMLFALPICFCRKKAIVFSYLVLANLYILSIIWYYRTYGTIMPLSSYLMFDNLKGLGPSISHSIRINDILLILPSTGFFILYLWYTKKFSSLSSTLKKSWKLSIILIIILGVAIPYLPNKRPSGKQPLYLYSTTQVGAFKKYGIIHYWVYQIMSFQKVSDKDKKYASEFINRLSQRKNFIIKDTLTTTNKNLIIILVESLQSWAIGLEVGKIEALPNLNQLLKQKNSVYFPYVMPQVKDGRSSDAQLLINTGLLPLVTGAASSLCATNTFPSLASALKAKGYFSASFICDNKNFWNQEATTIAYGFDELHDKMRGKERGKADESLFKQSLPILKKMKQPFYAQLVTLSSHEPYMKPLLEDSPLLQKTFDNVEVKNYLIALQYVDKCIAEFLEGLKKEGLYDNSIIIITGDHEQMTFNQYEGRVKVEVEDYFVPLIILNSPVSSEHTDKIIGQVDIYPSLLNLMGCYDYFWKGLGESVWEDNISNYATFRTGLAAGDIHIADSLKRYREECWKISDILLRTDYFKYSHP